MPAPRCFDDCGFVVKSEVKGRDTSNFVLFSRNVAFKTMVRHVGSEVLWLLWHLTEHSAPCGTTVYAQPSRSCRACASLLVPVWQ